MSPNAVLDVPGPKKAGEGDRPSSRSERRVVEGASEQPIMRAPEKITSNAQRASDLTRSVDETADAIVRMAAERL
jgi:hypothetical protein